MPVTITFDLEDNRRSPAQVERFTAMTERFLDHLDRWGVRATVFVVGEIGRSHPELVREVAARGHEIGLHGLRHVTLAEVGPDHLEAELREGRAILEDAVQQRVEGFRAPIFSLTPSTAWARDQIKRAGFSYSSSVLPASNPLHGWPGAPRTPFRWGNGLVELPCPVAGVGRARIPYLGGIYLRYVPHAASRRLLAGLDDQAMPWSYSHPYDFDAEEPFFVLPHAGWLTSRILFTRRRATLRRLEQIVRDQAAAPPLGQLVARIKANDLPVVA